MKTVVFYVLSVKEQERFIYLIIRAFLSFLKIFFLMTIITRRNKKWAIGDHVPIVMAPDMILGTEDNVTGAAERVNIMMNFMTQTMMNR